MPARLSAFLIWLAAAAGIVFWALRLAAVPIATPPGTTLASAGSGPRADLSRLLGTPPVASAAAAPPAAESARFRLLGVIAEGRPAAADAGRRQVAGVALLAIDGKPPRALRVGASIEGGLVLQSVSRRGAAIGPPGAPASVMLELPPLPAPATGEPARLLPDGSSPAARPGAPPMPVAPPPPFGGALPPGITALPPGLSGQPMVGSEPATATMRPPDMAPPPASR